ncbi:MAG: hypothetical protein WD010_00630, partial [Nitriliruptor sp.]
LIESVEIIKGPNIATLPDFEPLPDELELEVLLETGDDVSTDEILRAGAAVLPFRSNIPEIARFAFDVIDPTYHDRATAVLDEGGDGHAVIGGSNYGQGSSREHAALAPRHVGLRATLVESYARIHWQNLANFGVLPLQFRDPADREQVSQGDTIRLRGLHEALDSGSGEVVVENVTTGSTFTVRHELSSGQVERIRSGGVIRFMKQQLQGEQQEPSDRSVE